MSGRTSTSWQATPAERTGYPTQKPQALARRIIEASSNPGDIVLDCFAGCAYVPVAAEQTGRRWIACDMSPRAWTVVRRQFAKQPDLAMTVEGEEGEYEEASPRFEGKGVLRVRGPNRLPRRSARDAAAERLPLRANLAEIRFRQKPLESGSSDMASLRGRMGNRLLVLRPHAGKEQARPSA